MAYNLRPSLCVYCVRLSLEPATAREASPSLPAPALPARRARCGSRGSSIRPEGELLCAASLIRSGGFSFPQVHDLIFRSRASIAYPPRVQLCLANSPMALTSIGDRKLSLIKGKGEHH